MKEEHLINLPIEWKRGNGLRKSDLEDDGKLKCILYGELYTKHNDALIDNKDLSRTNKKGTFCSKKGDILVPGTSTASKKDMLLAREIDEDGVLLGGDINVIRPQPGLFAKKYLPYFFDTFSAYDQLDRYITGATGIIHISNSGLKKLKVPLPTYEEQQRIVSILDKAFTAIDKAKANAEQNLKNAKELFESYLKGVFENKLHGLKFETLDSLCELIVDCEHKTAPTQETGYPSIRTPNIGKGVLILEGVNRVSEKTYNEWTRRAIPQADDLILAREAPAGNIAVIPENVKVCLGQRTVLIRPKKNKLISKFLAHLILSKDVQGQLLSHSTGATVEHINMKDIRGFKIYNLSPLFEQETIVQKLDDLSAETKKLEAIYQQKIRDLEELKKSVLQKAFSGELNTEMEFDNKQVLSQ
jgi:type I restriction enzyme S subunit